MIATSKKSRPGCVAEGREKYETYKIFDLIK